MTRRWHRHNWSVWGEPRIVTTENPEALKYETRPHIWQDRICHTCLRVQCRYIGEGSFLVLPPLQMFVDDAKYGVI